MMRRSRFGSYLSSSAFRRPTLESLENKVLLTTDIAISEIQFAPTFVVEEEDQFLELRGTPNATIDQDVYFVTVEGDEFGGDSGFLKSRFNLGGLTFGSNGYLVFTQANSNFDVDPDATHLQGDRLGFYDIPGYDAEASFVAAGALEIVTTTTTFMVVSSTAEPVIREDYDTDDDGVLEGLASTWIVHDSVSVSDSGGPNDRVYGNILFRSDIGPHPITPPAGVPVVDVDAGYVARVTDGLGYTKDDWVAGSPREFVDDSFEYFLRLNDTYPLYGGHKIETVGGPNFYSTISGTLFHDENGNGVRDNGETPPAGESVYLDINNNGVRDDYSGSVEPDDVPDETLTRVGPLVVLNTVDGNGGVGVAPRSEDDAQRASTGTHYIRKDETSLRVDFLHPMQAVSVDAQLRDATLMVFDADGNQLESTTGMGTVSITRSTPDIAHAIIDQSTFGGLDNLQFSAPEPIASIDQTGNYTFEKIDLHVAGTQTVSVRPLNGAGSSTFTLDRPKIIANAETPFRLQPVGDDIVGRTETNQWWIARSEGSNFRTSFFGQWNPNVDWQDVVRGDFDGDNTTDLATRVGREWWVSRSNNQTLEPIEFWGIWPNAASWEYVTTVDLNGDGRSDLIGRDDGGSWWVGVSTGSSFIMERWTHWSINVTWDNIVFGDFTGDGLDDIAGRTNGNWYVANSTGQGFEFSQWGGWSNAITWEDVRVGDFDGDGRDDIAGRAGGNWWLAKSTGNAFQNQYWARWSNAVTWEDVVVGDFNGDGRDDITGRANGQWWVNRSLGSVFAVEYWGRWSTLATWEDVQVGDYDGDGQDDIAGRAAGNWWVSRSNSTFFSVEYWGTWSTVPNWRTVRTGEFDASSVTGSAHSANSNAFSKDILAKDLIFADEFLNTGVRVRGSKTI